MYFVTDGVPYESSLRCLITLYTVFVRRYTQFDTLLPPYILLLIVGPAWIFELISGFKGGRESFHWHGVVVELTVSWQPRCGTGNGCVDVSSLTSGRDFRPFHVCMTLDLNRSDYNMREFNHNNVQLPLHPTMLVVPCPCGCGDCTYHTRSKISHFKSAIDLREHYSIPHIPQNCWEHLDHLHARYTTHSTL